MCVLPFQPSNPTAIKYNHILPVLSAINAIKSS